MSHRLFSTSDIMAAVYGVDEAPGMHEWDTRVLGLLSPASLGPAASSRGLCELGRTPETSLIRD